MVLIKVSMESVITLFCLRCICNINDNSVTLALSALNIACMKVLTVSVIEIGYTRFLCSMICMYKSSYGISRKST